jgi:hypothetical protein
LAIENGLSSMNTRIYDMRALATQYEGNAGLLERGRRYRSMSGEQHDFVMQSQRSREQQQIQRMLQDLAGEIAGTQQAISQVVTKLPAPDAYQLPRAPTPQLQS